MRSHHAFQSSQEQKSVRKLAPHSTGVVLWIVLGSILPEADNLAVAVATVAKLPTEGLHRTFTHSLFTILVVVGIFWLISLAVRKPYWKYLGFGLGIGIGLHILLDLVIWFNGVALLWPIPSWVNFWAGYQPPAWWDKLMLSTEFLFFALSFMAMDLLARRQGTDKEYLGTLRIWTIVQWVLFAVFIVLVYVMQKGFMTPYGLIYLLSLALAAGVTIRMRRTVEHPLPQPAWI